jgi:uncharacterized membrane protein
MLAMVATPERRHGPPVHPLHVLLLGGMVTLFLGALLNDIAYAYTYEIQWSNFAAWLIVGGLVVSGIALVFALVGLAPSRRRPYSVLHALLLVATWIAALFNALMHARDAWAVMPGGLVLSAVALVIACLATCAGCCAPRDGGVR